MPTYVYECAECEHRFEVFQSFSAKAMRKCPQCRRSALRKVLFPAGVVFKGSGFYVNDSRSAAAKKTKSDSAKSDSGGGKGSGGEGDKGKSDGSGGKESSSKKEGGSASKKEPAASGSKSGS